MMTARFSLLFLLIKENDYSTLCVKYWIFFSFFKKIQNMMIVKQEKREDDREQEQMLLGSRWLWHHSRRNIYTASRAKRSIKKSLDAIPAPSHTHSSSIYLFLTSNWVSTLAFWPFGLVRSNQNGQKNSKRHVMSYLFLLIVSHFSNIWILMLGWNWKGYSCHRIDL